jgi:hypothetical protein
MVILAVLIFVVMPDNELGVTRDSKG